MLTKSIYACGPIIYRLQSAAVPTNALTTNNCRHAVPRTNVIRSAISYFVRLFGEWYGRQHPHEIGAPALEPAAPRPFFRFSPLRAPSRPCASHARADRFAHRPLPSGRLKACHYLRFESRTRAAAAGALAAAAQGRGHERVAALNLQQ